MEKSWMPTVSGVLCIITGCLALFGFLMMALFGLFFFNAPDFDADEFPFQFVRFAFGLGAVGSLLLGLVSIFGGVSALQRRRWGWSLAAAIAATLICAPLGVAAVILVVLAEEELKAAA